MCVRELPHVVAQGSNHIRILTFSTLYPNEPQPRHGIFVENRLRHLLLTGGVEARVIAPVAWFPSRSALFGDYAVQATVPSKETRYGMEINHPRFLLLPKIGMSVSAISLFLANIGTIYHEIRRHHFDIIDAHYFYPDGVAAVLLGEIFNKPVIITARGTDVNLIPRYSIPRWQIQFAARRAAALIAVSGALKDALVELGVAPDRVSVLRNGVDLENFRPGDRGMARRALNLSGPTLLSVGHLIERKGHDLAIGALPKLQNYSLLIAGDGPERSRLETLATQLGVSDRVRFLGAIPHERLRDVYEAADALVLASSREGWPNVLLESMACGTPVVASAIWGNPEVVSRPEAGVLMETRTPEGVAEAVEKLFRQLPSREATRAFAEEHSWQETSAGQLKLFRQVLANRKV
jgi:glycosyltransferase involved in cell wall biosynthesis